MEYQKIINLLDNTSNQPSKFRAIHWVEINYGSRGTYNTNSQIKFNTLMLKSSLCDYSDAYIIVKRIISGVEAGATPAAMQANRNNTQAIIKKCAPFTDCITEIDNTKADNAKDLDVAMSMYNLIENSDNYSKKHLKVYTNFAEMS